MSFIQTILKNIDDDPFIGTYFTKSEWITILNAFDAYTPNFKANVLGTEDDVSELNTVDSIATFLETIVANARAIDFEKDPIFDIGRFAKYLVLPEDELRKRRQLTTQSGPSPYAKYEPPNTVEVPQHLTQVRVEPPVKPAPIEPPTDPIAPQVSAPNVTIEDDSSNQQPTRQSVAPPVVAPTTRTQEPTPLLAPQDTDVTPAPRPSMATAISPKADSYDAARTELFDIYQTKFTNILASDIELRKSLIIVKGIPLAQLYLHEYSEDMRDTLVESFVEKRLLACDRNPKLLNAFIPKSPDTGLHFLNREMIDTWIEQDLREIALAIIAN